MKQGSNCKDTKRPDHNCFSPVFGELKETFFPTGKIYFFPQKHKILQLSKLQPKAWLLLFLKSRSGSRGQCSFPPRCPLRIISETVAGRMTMLWAVRGEDPSKDRKAKMRIPAKY